MDPARWSPRSCLLRCAILPSAFLSSAFVTGCAGITERDTTAKSVPHASQQAEIIIDRYMNDPELGDDLFNDKTVEIVAFRVDEVEETALVMKDRGFTLRLEDVSKAKIEKGGVYDLVCEGDGMSDEKTIVFEGCAFR
jgi:hypothetical protein